jgi:hypothetical protein
MFLRTFFSENDDFVRERKMCCKKRKYSESETSSEENDNTSNVGPTTWVKEDKMPNLGSFTGNPGVKQILTQQKRDYIIELLHFQKFFVIWFELGCTDSQK